MPPYRYRCAQCRTTSPELLSRRALHEERDAHRRRFHGGHIPDGEQVLAEPRMRLADLPMEQRVGLVILLLVVLVVGAAKLA
jgi:hypothetical protein